MEKETAIHRKKLTEPQEDRQTIEKMRRNVMLVSSGTEENKSCDREGCGAKSDKRIQAF